MSHAVRCAALWGLMGLFFLRVLGQILVEFLHVDFLPPSEEWQSGLLPYPVLLFSQIVILAIQAKVCLNFQRGQGITFEPRRRVGRFLRAFGSIYLATMVARYVIRMARYPEERWFGGCTPIFFHWVLAAFVLTVAFHHLKNRGGRLTATHERLSSQRVSETS